MKNKVLLIQSDTSDNSQIYKYLVEINYAKDSILAVPSLAEALSVSSGQIGLILTGVFNSDQSDLSGIQLLKKQFASVPIIVMLANDDRDVYIDAIRDGAQEILINGTFDAGKLGNTILIAKERKAQGGKIRNVLEDYQRHFDNGPIPMWIIDVRTMKFLIVNNAAVEKYGYSKEEFAAMSLVDIRPADDVDDMIKLINREGRPAYFDAGYRRHIKKNGEIFYVHVYTHNTVFETMPAKLCFIVDVNEKLIADKENRELNELIKEQKEQLDSILFSINDAIWSRRADTRELLYANNAYYKLYDHSPEDLKADSELFLNSVYPDDRKIFLQAMEEVKATGKTEIVYRYVHKNGSIKTFKASATFKKGINGKPDTVNGNTIDITTEKELYDAIRNSEHKLLSTINNTKDLIWTVDTNLRIIFCNKPYQDYFYRLAGVVLDEGDYVLGNWHSESFIKRRKMEYQRALNGESFTTVIEENRDEGIQYNEISSNPVMDHHGNIIGVNCIVRDITEQRMQLLKIQQQNDLLKEIAWLQSHKVRGPVASILGLIPLIDRETESLHNAEIIDMLHDATTELDNIIREVVAKTNDIDYSYTYLPSVKTNK